MSERDDAGAAKPGDGAADQNGADAAANLSLEEQLEAARAEAKENHDRWLRAYADFQNFRRRTEAERAEMAAFAASALLKKILEVVDDFDLALANVPTEARDSKWGDGIAIIQRKLLRLLESEQVTPIEALGQPFDPNLHEAVVVDDGASEPHHVVAELRRGYKLRDRVLRATLVRVGNPSAVASAGQGNS